jgi:hypothetical protein
MYNKSVPVNRRKTRGVSYVESRVVVVCVCVRERERERVRQSFLTSALQALKNQLHVPAALSLGKVLLIPFKLEVW